MVVGARMMQRSAAHYVVDSITFYHGLVGGCGAVRRCVGVPTFRRLVCAFRIKSTCVAS